MTAGHALVPLNRGPFWAMLGPLAESSHGKQIFLSALARQYIKILFVPSAAESSNGRTSPSGGEYLGSNPSSAALGGNVLQIFIYCTCSLESRTIPSAGVYLGSNPKRE